MVGEIGPRLIYPLPEVRERTVKRVDPVSEREEEEENG
jgi:hypothetical protein